MDAATLQIRPATVKDFAFCRSLSRRLVATAQIDGRSHREIVAFEASLMSDALEHPLAESALLLAFEPDGTRLGFIHAEPSVDQVTDEACGYVTLIAVTEAAEGRGVATLLLQAAEDWAREKGFARLSLDVFANNHRAFDFYRGHGFGVEWRRLSKRLR